jgi:peptide/nickel transport system ATP-binding protein
LEVDRVTAAYGGGLKVLDDVTVSVPRGRTVAVVGESGSGKSTLARAITGLLPPISGEIRFNGKKLPRALKDRDRDTLRRVQMIYQMPDTAVNPKHRVREVIGRPVEFYLGKKGSARDQRVSELLRMIELDDSYFDRLPGELSGGQKQRICIARALAAEPDLIICDEVTSALDQIVQEEILKLLMKLQRDLGVTYMFITHDIATVNAIADRIVVMYRGRVVEQARNRRFYAATPAIYGTPASSVPKWIRQFTNLLARRSDPGAMAAADSGNERRRNWSNPARSFRAKSRLVEIDRRSAFAAMRREKGESWRFRDMSNM